MDQADIIIHIDNKNEWKSLQALQKIENLKSNSNLHFT